MNRKKIQKPFSLFPTHYPSTPPSLPFSACCPSSYSRALKCGGGSDLIVEAIVHPDTQLIGMEVYFAFCILHSQETLDLGALLHAD